jgi:hypothetical protein
MSGTTGSIEAAGAHLEAARAEFEAYSEDGQMTSLIADAWDLTAAALGRIAALETEQQAGVSAASRGQVHVVAYDDVVVVRLYDQTRDNPVELNVAKRGDGLVAVGMEDRDSGNVELWTAVNADALRAALALVCVGSVSVEV